MIKILSKYNSNDNFIIIIISLLCRFDFFDDTITDGTEEESPASDINNDNFSKYIDNLREPIGLTDDDEELDLENILIRIKELDELDLQQKHNINNSIQNVNENIIENEIEKIQINGNCKICYKITIYRCNGCYNNFYCSRRCQKKVSFQTRKLH